MSPAAGLGARGGDGYGIAAVFAAVLGILFATWLYGWRVLDPRSFQWLLHGDPAQHYIGAVYFLGQAWQWPPGVIRGVGAGGADSSVILADALPLLALPAKLLGWPAHWQYFGAWLYGCHGLAAGVGVLLLRRLGCAPGAAFAGALLFALAPVLLLRAYGHEALQGQFLVLAALVLALGRWRVWPWLLLSVVAVAVHPYLAAMVLALMLAGAAAAWQQGQVPAWRLMRVLALACTLALGSAYLVGYFGLGGQYSAPGFGFFSANLLTWFDPMDWAGFLARFGRDAAQGAEWSRVLPALGQASAGQYEGFAYLGVGVLALLAVALASLPLRPDRGTCSGTPPGRLGWVVAACVALALLAVSNQPAFGEHALGTLPLWPSLEKLAGVFRASGRFVWPLTYLLMAWAIARVGRLPAGATWVSLALMVQLYDLSDKLVELRGRFQQGPPGIAAAPTAPLWGAMLTACPRVELLFWPAEDGRWITPALAAARAGASVTPLPLARPRPQEEHLQRQALLARQAGHGWRQGTLYVAPPSSGNASVQAPPGYEAHVADGFIVFAAPGCLPAPALNGDRLPDDPSAAARSSVPLGGAMWG